MRRSWVFIAAIALIAFASSLSAMYSVANKGMWPKDWPEELEPLRETSRTLVGPILEQQHFAIPFRDRESFEKNWPHLVSVKTAGAPIVLKRGPNFFLGDQFKAGVVIHCPPKGVDDKAVANPFQADKARRGASRFMSTCYIELVVDGSVVDLNRILIPQNTPIIDERFDTVRE